MSQFDAILWDCDGVLIDSEWIACQSSATFFTDHDYPITTQEFVERFCGQSKAHIYDTISQELGYDIQDKMDMDEKQRLRDELFRKHLEPIENVLDVIHHKNAPSKQAIAYGSDPDRLQLTLKISDIYQYFIGHIYSSTLVKNGKPAPDIYLYAADQLNVDPKRCLVIEDSLNGVRSGTSAGMTVWGFVGGKHIVNKDEFAQRLIDLGAIKVFQTMNDLSKFL